MAFCDGHGKLQNQPRNELAQTAWEMAIARGSYDPQDSLAATVAVVFGYRDFMSEI